jgi:hypothetical protein
MPMTRAVAAHQDPALREDSALAVTYPRLTGSAACSANTADAVVPSARATRLTEPRLGATRPRSIWLRKDWGNPQISDQGAARGTVALAGG